MSTTWPRDRETASANIRSSSPSTSARASSRLGRAPLHARRPAPAGAAASRAGGGSARRPPAARRPRPPRTRGRWPRSACRRARRRPRCGRRACPRAPRRRAARRRSPRPGRSGYRSTNRRAAVNSATTPSRWRLASSATMPLPLRVRQPARGEPAALPGVPEQLLDRGALRRLLAARPQRLGQPGGAAGGRGVDRREAARAAASASTSSSSPGPVALARELLLAEGEPEPAQADAVEPAERPEEKLGRDDRCELDRAQLDARDRSPADGRRSRRAAAARRCSCVVGTSATARARARAGTCAPERTITAISLHGTPSSRCRSRSLRASRDASDGRGRRDEAHDLWALVLVARHRAPARGRPAAAMRCTPAAAVPMRSVTRAVSSRSAGVCRCAVVEHERASTGTPSRDSSWPSAVVSAPRNVVEATSGSPKATTATPRVGEGAQQREGGDGGLLQVVDERRRAARRASCPSRTTVTAEAISSAESTKPPR